MLSTLRTHDNTNFIPAVLEVGRGRSESDLQRKSGHNLKNLYSTNILFDLGSRLQKHCTSGKECVHLGVRLYVPSHTRQFSVSADGAWG